MKRKFLDSETQFLELSHVNVARGDVSTAAYWLSKALGAGDVASVQSARALVDVELAEVRHMDGDIEGARRYALAVVFRGRRDQLRNLMLARRKLRPARLRLLRIRESRNCRGCRDKSRWHTTRISAVC